MSPKYCVYSRYSVNPGPGLCLAGLPKPRDRAQNQCSELLSTLQRPREESPVGHFLDGKTESEVASVKRDCDEKKSQSGGRQAWLDLRTGVCLSGPLSSLQASLPGSLSLLPVGTGCPFPRSFQQELQVMLSENLMPRAWTQGLCVGLNLSSVPEGTKLGALLLLGTRLDDHHRDIQLPRVSLEAVHGGLRCHSGLAGSSEPL